MSDARKRAEEALAKWEGCRVCQTWKPVRAHALSLASALRALLAELAPAAGEREENISCPACNMVVGRTSVAPPPRPAQGSRADDYKAALSEATALLVSLAPHVEVDGTLSGMLSQISNAVTGLRPAQDAVREAAERLELLRLVAAEGCRDEAGSGVSCRAAAIPPDDVCEVCRVIEYLAALRSDGR